MDKIWDAWLGEYVRAKFSYKGHTIRRTHARGDRGDQKWNYRIEGVQGSFWSLRAAKEAVSAL